MPAIGWPTRGTPARTAQWLRQRAGRRGRDVRIWVTQPAPGRPRIGALVAVRQLQNDGHDAHFVSWDDASPQLSFGFSGFASVSTVSTPDAWFVSVLGHRDWWSMAGLRDRLRGAPIVMGGQCADLMEGWYAGVGDHLAIGDIHASDRSRIYDAVRGGPGGPIVLARTSSPPLPIITAAGLMVFLANGCNRRCPYCRISASHHYAETSCADAWAAVERYPGRRVSLYTPSGDHPSLGFLLDRCSSLGKTVTNRDFHPARAQQLLAEGKSIPGRIRVGIEGVSERLRTAIYRPMTWSALARLMAAVATHQYYLVGIPGESAADWEEFEHQMIDILTTTPRAHWITLGTFTPIPGTPWGEMPGEWSAEVAGRIAHFKSRLIDLNRGGIKAILATARSRELHEAEVVTMRAAVRKPAALGRFIGRVTPSMIPDGRWRALAESVGLSIHGLLAESAERSAERATA